MDVASAKDTSPSIRLPRRNASLQFIYNLRTLDDGERVDVGTLLWTPSEKPSPLVENLVDNLGLELNEDGHVEANEMQQTNVDRLWAAGDVQGWTGAIESANAGGMAAFFMAHGWYGEPRED